MVKLPLCTMSPKEISSYPPRRRFQQRTGPFFSLYDIQAGSSDSICVWTPIHRRGQGSEEAEKFSTSKFWVIQVLLERKAWAQLLQESCSFGFPESETSPPETTRKTLFLDGTRNSLEHTWSRPTSTITIYFNCTEKATCERPHQ